MFLALHILLQLALAASPAWASGCAGTIVAIPGLFHSEQFGLLERWSLSDLYSINTQMQNGQLTAADLFDRGVLVEADTRLFKLRDGEPMLDQPVPFKEIRLPFAQSGVYVPKDFNPRAPQTAKYSGYAIAIPGIGAQISDAKTLFDIGGTFEKGKRTGYKMMPLLLDATLGGMAAGAPDLWGSPEASVAVVRHVVLVMSILCPQLLGNVWGRSQGGLIALEYASLYADIAGAIAVNPPYPTRRMVDASVEKTEASANGGAFKGVNIKFNRSWEVYKRETPNFSCIRRRTQVPQLILLGSQDPGYPQPDHVDLWSEFALRQHSSEVEVYEAGHNLWAREDTVLFEAVVERMARFTQECLATQAAHVHNVRSQRISGWRRLLRALRDEFHPLLVQ